MTIGPTVLRPQPLPGLGVVCAVLAAFLLLQTILMAVLGMWPLVILSLVFAIIFVVGALYYRYHAARSAVMIDTDTLTIKTAAGEQVIKRSDIDLVDGLSLGDQLLLNDGSTAFLPLEGRQLAEAKTLLASGFDATNTTKEFSE